MDGWQPGNDEKTKLMAASLLMLLVAVMCFITVCAAISGCCTFNTGSLSGAKAQWRDHIASPGKMIQAQLEEGK